MDLQNGRTRIPLNRERMLRYAVLAIVFPLGIVLGPSTAAASIFTGVVLNLNDGPGSVVTSGASPVATLATSSPCGAAQGFANAVNGTLGVADSTVPACGVSFMHAAFADAQVADGWSCNLGCGITQFNLTVWDTNLTGTLDGALGTQGIFTLQDTIKVNFEPVYTVFVSAQLLSNGTLRGSASLTDKGIIDNAPASTTFPVTITGDRFSVDIPSTILLPTGGFDTTMEATAVSNGSVDFYDPVQSSFTSTNPNIQFSSDGGDSTIVGTVPEPGTLLLIGVGLAGLGALPRRKRKTA
jgi:PEP-CTERM motif